MKFTNEDLFRFRDVMGVPLHVAISALTGSPDLESAKAWARRHPNGVPAADRIAALERRILEIENTAKHLQEQSTALIRQAKNLSEAVERITGILERLVPDDK